MAWCCAPADLAVVETIEADATSSVLVEPVASAAHAAKNPTSLTRWLGAAPMAWWCCAPADLALVEVVIAADDASSVLVETNTSAAHDAAGNPTLLTRPCSCVVSPAARIGHRDEGAKIGHGDEGARPDAEGQEEDEDDDDQFPPPIGVGSQTSWPRLTSGDEDGRPSAARGRSRRSQAPLEVKAARREQRAQARELVRPFLEQNGFATVKSESARHHPAGLCYPLHVAVTANNVELIQRLLRAGANPFRRDSLGRTPLELAHKLNRFRSHRRAVEVLRRATRDGKHWVPWLRNAAGDLAVARTLCSSSSFCRSTAGSSAGDLSRMYLDTAWTPRA